MSLRLDCAPNCEDWIVLSHDMRPDEVEQFAAISGLPAYDQQLAARTFITIPGEKFLLVDENNRSVIGGGFMPLWKGVCEAWMAGPLTAWEKHGKAITRAARRLIDAKLAEDAHRVQIACLASRTAAMDWYSRGLGMACEGLKRRYYAGGQDAMMFAKVRED